MVENIATIPTTFGTLAIVEQDGKITDLHWSGQDQGERTPLLSEALSQLQAYCQKRLTVFDLPLAPKGNKLQQQVLKAMYAIPYGETVTYGDIATSIDAPAQAVGQACGRNPIPIIIPCHRVTAANGLGGFSSPSGVEQKIAFLRHEGAYGLLI